MHQIETDNKNKGSSHKIFGFSSTSQTQKLTEDIKKSSSIIYLQKHNETQGIGKFMVNQ